MKKIDIAVLCKVVDNFGDIGVVFRLAKSILKLNQNKNFFPFDLHLVVDGLDSFSKINPLINPELPFQKVNLLKNELNYNENSKSFLTEIFDWNASDFCSKNFYKKNKESQKIILECFQCGRPEWLEKILFEKNSTLTANIIMIDYLTAENYAENFHCLPSLTRSSRIKKVNFMPGFTKKTGSLLMNEIPKKNPEYKNDVLFFCYDKNWNFLCKAIKRFFKDSENSEILVAQGKGKKSFLKSSEKIFGKCDFVKELPFLTQEKWDEILFSCGFLFVRGEDSMSQACLSGIPFVWQAYPQSEEYQIVKVKALLSKLLPYFSEELGKLVQKTWILFNCPVNEFDEILAENCVYQMLLKKNELKSCFERFSLDLRNNGDLAFNLMTFIKENIILKQ